MEVGLLSRPVLQPVNANSLQGKLSKLEGGEEASKTKSFLAGHVSLDIHVERSLSATAMISNGTSSISRTIERSFEADYHFDFAFLAELDSAPDKLAQLSPSLLNDFMKTAQGLTSMEEGDLQNFTDSVDKLFGELEQVLGRPSEMLDTAKELFKSTLSGFMQRVRTETEKIYSMPTSSPEVEGAGIDMKKLLEETMGEFNDNLFNMLEEMMTNAKRALFDQQKLLAEMLDDKDKSDKEGGLSSSPLAERQIEA